MLGKEIDIYKFEGELIIMLPYIIGKREKKKSKKSKARQGNISINFLDK